MTESESARASEAPKESSDGPQGEEKDRLHEIVESVAAVHGVSPSEILGRNARKEVIRARRQAVYLSFERTELTPSQIAEVFADRTTDNLWGMMKRMRDDLREEGAVRKELALVDDYERTGQSQVERYRLSICAHLGVQEEDLHPASTRPKGRFGRKILSYLLLEDAGLPPLIAGRRMGYKFPASILAGASEIASTIETDHDLRTLVDDIKATYEEGPERQAAEDPATVLDLVENYYGLSADALKGSYPSALETRAQAMAMVLLENRTSFSKVEIAEAFETLTIHRVIARLDRVPSYGESFERERQALEHLLDSGESPPDSLAEKAKAVIEEYFGLPLESWTIVPRLKTPRPMQTYSYLLSRMGMDRTDIEKKIPQGHAANRTRFAKKLADRMEVDDWAAKQTRQIVEGLEGELVISNLFERIRYAARCLDEGKVASRTRLIEHELLASELDLEGVNLQQLTGKSAKEARNDIAYLARARKHDKGFGVALQLARELVYGELEPPEFRELQDVLCFVKSEDGYDIAEGTIMEIHTDPDTGVRHLEISLKEESGHSLLVVSTDESSAIPVEYWERIKTFPGLIEDWAQRYCPKPRTRKLIVDALRESTFSQHR